jgi:hypothetical protein
MPPPDSAPNAPGVSSIDLMRSELIVERSPPPWYSAGTSTPSMNTRVSLGADPHTIS